MNKPIPPNHLFNFLSELKNDFGYKGYFSVDGFTIKRDALEKSNVLFNENLRLHQDTVFLWQLAFFLKLYTGEFDRPIAMRGVHADNRFIHKSNLHKGRSKQYKVLRDWAVNQEMPSEICRVFNQKYFKHYISSRPRKLRVQSYISLLIKDKYTQRTFGKKQLKTVWFMTTKK